MSFSLSAQFSNSIVYDQPNVGLIAQIPSTVILLGFELWGGGGGGGTNSGGQGGGYLQGTVKIGATPNVNTLVGAGGIGGQPAPGIPPAPGGDTSVTVRTASGAVFTATAHGGAADGGIISPGYAVSDPKVPSQQMGLTGQYANHIADIQLAYGSGYYLTSYKCADGGSGANTTNTHGYGGFFIVQTFPNPAGTPSSNPFGSFNYPPLPGNAPGGGGGAGILYNTGLLQHNTISGAGGAGGRIIIYY